VLRSLTGRIEQLLEGSRKDDWQPQEQLPSSQSGWVDALLSYLQVRLGLDWIGMEWSCSMMWYAIWGLQGALQGLGHERAAVVPAGEGRAGIGMEV
jgi:hypothetical protein